MYKDTFKMTGGDTVIGVSGDLVLVGGQEELRQNVENRLSVNISEWFLNLGLGLKYASIEGKGVTDDDIDFAVRECVLQDERVKEIKSVEIVRNGELRTAEINLILIDAGDDELYLKGVVDIG